MIRLYGRSIRGKRCFDKTPHKWKTITMLSSIRSDGHTESIVFKGALNKKIFELYVEKVLAPSLRPGDIVLFAGTYASGGITHAGLYIGNSYFIHAANSRSGVIITNLNDEYYYSHFVCGRRIVN